MVPLLSLFVLLLRNLFFEIILRCFRTCLLFISTIIANSFQKKINAFKSGGLDGSQLSPHLFILYDNFVLRGKIKFCLTSFLRAPRICNRDRQDGGLEIGSKKILFQNTVHWRKVSSEKKYLSIHEKLAADDRFLQRTQNVVISRIQLRWAEDSKEIMWFKTHVQSYCSTHESFCLVALSLQLPSPFV